ncbi:hypothetical protein AVEN_255682-1 [Araneus ventricosus]|uniref:Uncharacterized protein n=1 Tax=Araneus ventricosus TaxID=182803 RepID=A0A4Y2H309_ARAVE|nr:hypothetical protein AVEN_255682-1 [Araneus ventricosus]
MISAYYSHISAQVQFAYMCPGLSAKKYLNPTWEKYKSGSIRILTRSLVVLFPEKQKSIFLLKPKTTFLSLARGLVISQVVFHFTKLQKVARPSIILVYCNLHKGRFGNPGLMTVHLLYSPKNTAFSSPRHVRYSVNQRLCQVIPAAGMVFVTK